MSIVEFVYLASLAIGIGFFWKAGDALFYSNGEDVLLYSNGVWVLNGREGYCPVTLAYEEF